MTEFDLPPESAPPGPLIRLIRDQRVAFLIVGAVNTVVGLALFVVCSETVGHVVDRRLGRVAGSLVTVTLSHVLSVLFAFVMHRRLVFRVRGHVLRDLVRFESVYLTTFGINVVALTGLVALGVHRIPAQMVVFVPILVLNYLGHRYFSFRRSAADSQDETLRT